MAASDILDERDVTHLLRRAGFGASPRDLVHFTGLSRAEAVDELLSVKPSAARGPGATTFTGGALMRLQSWWLKRMLSPRYRLQEKMVLFWHDHFATSASVVHRLDAMAAQNAMFRLHGLGSFHNLLHQVTRDRAMLEFLDGRRNRVGEVNENYARELMELFTLGPTDEDGFENYKQTDVVSLARALTGFFFDTTAKKPVVSVLPSLFDPSHKVLFLFRSYQAAGVLGVEYEDGTPFPPETNALSALFGHRDERGRPTLARFLVRKLWAWFATPDADGALVDGLSELFGASGYQISALVRALLEHDAFWAEEARHATPKMPVEFATQALLALGVKSTGTELPRVLTRMGMDLFDPPGVEGWQHGTAWLATSRYLARLELAQAIASGRGKNSTASGRGKNGFSFKLKLPLGVTPQSLVDEALARLRLEVSAQTRQHAIDYLAQGEFGSALWLETKWRGLFVLLLGLPEFQVH